MDDVNFEDGTKALLQTIGVGKLRPNVLMMGYKGDWTTCPPNELVAYFNVLHEAFNNRVAVAIVRVPGGLDFSAITDEEYLKDQINEQLTTTSNPARTIHSDDNLTLDLRRIESDTSLGCLPVDSPYMTRKNVNEKPSEIIKIKKKAIAEQKKEHSLNPNEQSVPQNILHTMSIFEKKQEKGTIDVWWLYDDGGLTILLPYIINTRQNWSSCKLRVFALANRKQELELETRNMASLLSKFRIDYASLIMVEDITAKPKEETQKLFNDIMKEYSGKKDHEMDDYKDAVVTDSELMSLRDKTNRHLRLRELLLQHSKSAKLVVMSLPMPRKSMVSAPLYMAWLEIISRDMPPIMLVRGNQTSVLTFYS